MLIDSSLVSVIMPVYNSGKFLSEAIESVLCQSHHCFELIIVDDFSVDDSRDIIFYFVNRDNRIRYNFLKERSGVGIARNVGLSMAKGKYIAFLDSDDLWYCDKLRKSLDFMIKNETDFFVSSYQYFTPTLTSRFNPASKIDYLSLLKSCDIGTSSVVYNRDKLGNLLMPNTRLKQDYLTWLRVLYDVGPVSTSDEVLSRIRKHSGSSSYNKLRAFRLQYKALSMHFGRDIVNFKLFYYLIIYSFIGFKKHYLA